MVFVTIGTWNILWQDEWVGVGVGVGGGGGGGGGGGCCFNWVLGLQHSYAMHLSIVDVRMFGIVCDWVVLCADSPIAEGESLVTLGYFLWLPGMQAT